MISKHTNKENEVQPLYITVVCPKSLHCTFKTLMALHGTSYTSSQ